MTTSTRDGDDLLDQVQAAYWSWRRTPRWRWWKRLGRREEWMMLVARLQDREQKEAIERRGRR